MYHHYNQLVRFLLKLDLTFHILIHFTGFRKVFVQKNEANVAVITNLNLSKTSGVIEALEIYNGNIDANLFKIQYLNGLQSLKQSLGSSLLLENLLLSDSMNQIGFSSQSALSFPSPHFLLSKPPFCPHKFSLPYHTLHYVCNPPY